MTARTKLKLVEQRSPSRSFLSLTRNIDMALNPPTKFEPTKKESGDVVI